MQRLLDEGYLYAEVFMQNRYLRDHENIAGGRTVRKLLNTLYITNEDTYLTLDGENLVCKAEGEARFRIPFDDI